VIGLDGPPTADCVSMLLLLLLLVALFSISIFLRMIPMIPSSSDEVDGILVSICLDKSAATKDCASRIFPTSAATVAGVVGRKRKPPRALSCVHDFGLPGFFVRGTFFVVVVVVVAGIGFSRLRQHPL